MFKPKLSRQEQGFTLVEVLVAILITSLFVGVAMDAMVIAAFSKVRAQQYGEATNWIQQDLENVKNKAANLQYTSLTADAAQGASSINVASANDFVKSENLKVGSDPGTYQITSDPSSGNPLTITPIPGTAQSQGLGTAQSQGAVVVATTRCKSSVLTADANKGATSINVAFANNFAVNDSLKVGSDSGSYKITVINKTVLTIDSPLQSNQLEGAAVVVADSSKGFAEYLRLNMPTNVDTTKSIKIGNIPYNPIINTSSNPNPRSVGYPNTKSGSASKLWLLRNAADSPNAPYNVLQLNYAVVPDVNGSPGTSPVATLYTEVIPNVALQCP